MNTRSTNIKGGKTLNEDMEEIQGNMHMASRRGLRPQNEDAHEAIININGTDGTKKNVNLYAVFDGHGGKDVSAYVKENLPRYLLKSNVEYPLTKRYVVTVYDEIQKSLATHNYSHFSGSTGLVIIHFKLGNDNYLNVLNNGDSRCILCRDNFPMPLTKDHKPNWPEEYHRIGRLGKKPVFDGFDWRINDLSVSRAFGDLDAAPYVTHQPDLFRYKLDKADKFIVVGCDGLYDVLSNSDIVNFILMNSYDSTFQTRINKNVNIAAKLANYALKRGSTDNVSVIIVFLD
jgi:serine/threonine protein phosphatase PrpC